MAEGGSPHDYEFKDTKDGNILDSHLLECPVCLEQLRRPKSLPCLHTFCEECLGTYITKDLSGGMASATSFPCPICRTLTQLVNPSEDKENWAQQFPTNSLIQELVQGKTNEPYYCKPCQKKGNLEVPATTWCKTCKVFFCNLCRVNHHDLLHDECETIDVSNTECISGPEESAIRKCGKHSLKMEYYCEDHQVVGCTKCVIEDHRRCEVVTTATEYYDTLNGNSRWDEWTGSLRESAEYFAQVIIDFGEKIKMKSEQEDTSFTSITDLRQRVDARLNAMQEELIDELVSATKADKENLEVAMQKCERLMSSVQNTLESSEKAVQKKDFIKTILLYQRGQVEVESCKDLVTEMKKSLMTASVKHVVDPSLRALNKDAPLSLGKIVVDKQPISLPDCTDYLRTSLSERCAKEMVKFTMRCPSDTQDCFCCGVVYLPTDQIVLADCANKKLKLFTAEGEFLDEMKLSGCAVDQDMCVVDATTVAVVVCNPPAVHVVKIVLFKLSPSSIIKSPGDQKWYGLTYIDGDFIVSTSNKEVCKVTRDGKVDTVHKSISQCYHLACDQRHGHIYASRYTYTASDVAVLKMSGQTRTDIMKGGVVLPALGIDVDKEGNVYVCGRASHNVVQMSEDGTNVRELLTQSAGMLRPRAVSVCGDKFVVTNESSEHCKEVSVFQMI